jgi:hypothetical protein
VPRNFHVSTGRCLGIIYLLPLSKTCLGDHRWRGLPEPCEMKWKVQDLGFQNWSSRDGFSMTFWGLNSSPRASIPHLSEVGIILYLCSHWNASEPYETRWGQQHKELYRYKGLCLEMAFLQGAVPPCFAISSFSISFVFLLKIVAFQQLSQSWTS